MLVTEDVSEHKVCCRHQQTHWIIWLRRCYTGIAALIVKGWRAGSDSIVSNPGGDHGTQKRQTSEAISQKTQSAAQHATLRSAGIAQARPRLAAFPKHAGAGQPCWYRKDVGGHLPLCGTLQRCVWYGAERDAGDCDYSLE